MAARKAQSAMEYLMTYGWAILVIAIVLGVLYSLGIFNGIGTVPRAQPGSCQVYKPGGPGTNQNVNLVGTCGGVLPEFVAQMGTGQVESISQVQGPVSGTFSIWINPSPAVVPPPGYPQIASIPVTNVIGMYVQAGTGDPYVQLRSVATVSTIPLKQGVWQMITATWNYSNGNTILQIYVNGASGSSSPQTYSGQVNGATNLYVGMVAQNQNLGQAADFQFYNTSLSPTEVSALYNGGIGGAPVRPQNLVVWWPLNGNSNDYSGNNYQGQVTSVRYISNWTTAYPTG